MLKVTDFEYSFNLVTKSNSAILISVSDVNEYADGKPTGKRLGTRYSCIAPARKYSEFSVKVADTAPCLTQEQIDKVSQPVMVSFDDFVGKFYKIRNTCEYAFSATASKINLLKA